MTSITMRHVGGELHTVYVVQATTNGVIHVQWGEGAGSGQYCLHVFRVVKDRKGAGWLFSTPGAKIPLAWQAVDIEGARALWRRLTGRQEVERWRPTFLRKGKTNQGNPAFGAEVCPDCHQRRDTHDEWDFRFCFTRPARKLG